jgi:uncharacterized membrane protein
MPMSPKQQLKPQASKAVQFSTIGSIILGIAIYQAVAPKWFPIPPGGGFNFTRILVAGLVGGVFAVMGAAVGKLVDGLRL